MGLLERLLRRDRKLKKERLEEAMVRSGLVSSLVDDIPSELLEASQLLRVIEYVRGLPVDVHAKVLVFTSWAKEVGYQPTASDYLALKRRWL